MQVYYNNIYKLIQYWVVKLFLFCFVICRNACWVNVCSCVYSGPDRWYFLFREVVGGGGGEVLGLWSTQWLESSDTDSQLFCMQMMNHSLTWNKPRMAFLIRWNQWFYTILRMTVTKVVMQSFLWIIIVRLNLKGTIVFVHFRPWPAHSRSTTRTVTAGYRFLMSSSSCSCSVSGVERANCCMSLSLWRTGCETLKGHLC